MSNRVFNSIAILGVGLIGGSLALAARARGVVGEVRGWGRNPERLQRALALEAVDTIHTDLAEALSGVDCAVVATPTQHAEQLLLETLQLVDEHTVITDVASVKANLARALRGATALAGKAHNVVLAHPIAGSERSGVGAAEANLFAGQRVILTPLPDTDEQAEQNVAKLWSALGAEIHRMDPEVHDAVLGHTSHLPHLLAFALVDYLQAQSNADAMFNFSGGGFRDFTRIASSDPRMWREIAMANREALSRALAGYRGEIDKMLAALEAGNGDELEACFDRARRARDQQLGKRR